MDMALTLVVPFSDAEYLTTHGASPSARCGWRTGRRISAVQRRKSYALLRDIADWTGYEPQELKELMKYDFLSQCEDGDAVFQPFRHRHDYGQKLYHLPD